MRRVIDTHWGKDANPWCLLARAGKADETTPEFWEWVQSHFNDVSEAATEFQKNQLKWQERYENETGKSPIAVSHQLDGAWRMWEHYGALPKRVAFKDGKLLAFMATENLTYPETKGWDEFEGGIWKEEFDQAIQNGYEWSGRDYMEEFHPDVVERYDSQGTKPLEQWWDRQDSPHDGIPLGEIEIPDDKLHRRVDMGELKGGKITIPNGMKKYIGRKGERGYRAWNDANTFYEDIGFGSTVRREDVPSRELRRQLKNLWIGTLHRGGDFSIGKIIGMFDDGFKLQAMMDGDGKPITEKDESYQQYAEELSDLISAFQGDNGKESKNVSDELVSALVGDAFVADEPLQQGETLQEHD